MRRRASIGAGFRAIGARQAGVFMRISGSVYAWTSLKAGSVYAQARECLCVDKIGYSQLLGGKAADVARTRPEDQA